MSRDEQHDVIESTSDQAPAKEAEPDAVCGDPVTGSALDDEPGTADEPIGELKPVIPTELPDVTSADAESELAGRRGLQRVPGAYARWTFLAVAAGVVGSLAACLFVIVLVHLISAVDSVRAQLPWWAIFAFPPLGGLPVGAMMWRADRSAVVSACGTDSFIDAVEEADGDIAVRVPILRIVGAWLTIGFGGCSGRECPMIYTGAGLGSTTGKLIRRLRTVLPPPLDRWLDLTGDETRLMALCGAAGALGGIFGAPFGGAVFACEVPYRRDVDLGVLWPVAVASTTGYGVGLGLLGRKIGGQTLFRFDPIGHLRPAEWVLIAALVAVCSQYGRFFAWLFNQYHHIVVDVVHERGLIPVWAKIPAGALLAGLVMVAFPQTYGIGDEGIRDMVAGRVFTTHTAAVAVILLLGMGVAKLLACTFTVGSGGIGGLLVPCLFAGAALGDAAGMAAHAIAPHTFTHPVAFILIGMSATFGAAGNVPLAAVLLLAEATGNFSLALPMLVGNGLAMLLSSRSSIYDVQRPDHGPHGLRRYAIATVLVLAVIALNTQKFVL